MTNREDELLANNIGQTPIGGQQPQQHNSTSDLTTITSTTCGQSPNQNEPQGIVSDGATGQISELWSENPPSSASSGFSDDDSLAGTEGDAKTIEQIVQMVRERGRQGLVQEYLDIRSRAPEGTFTNARLRNNLAKNRYTDVLCYDHSRVVLSQEEEEDPSSDYINANFVDGYRQKNAYISTQGPLPKTASDFWRMVWEQHCLVIVMTTRVMERGRIKCGQYWDTAEGNANEFGLFRIRTVSVDTKEDYTVASLELTNTKVSQNILKRSYSSSPYISMNHSRHCVIK